MQTDSLEQVISVDEKQSFAVEFFSAFYYILLYALSGLKFIFLDMWMIMFRFSSWKVDSAYQKVRSSDEADDELYEITKFRKEKKVRQYHYSKAMMNKYENMKIALNQDLQGAGAQRSQTPNIYQYIIKDPKTGRIFKETMSGYSKLDINSFLVNQGYEVYDIRTSDQINFLYKESGLFGSRISSKNLVFFLTQLATYIRAGITLNESMEILAIQMKKDKKLQRVLQSICYELTLGESFSNALLKQGSYFPALLINMMKAAEAAGTLQETLDDMTKYYTEVNATKKEMISAMTYPAIITVFAVSVVTFIIIYVVPQFTNIYAQSDIEITGVTKLIVGLSGFLRANIAVVFLVFLLAMAGVFVAYKKVKAFRVPCQILMMNIPVVKDVIIYKELNIFAKTFASLLRNNVFITESMDILSKITNNEIYKAILYKTINNIVKGEKISDAFKDHWAVPDVAYYMIVTGESTGQLADMMQKVSDYYQGMHKSIVNSLKSVIEPVMIVMLAIMVGIIIIAVIVPMFQLYNGIL